MQPKPPDPPQIRLAWRRLAVAIILRALDLYFDALRLKFISTHKGIASVNPSRIVSRIERATGAWKSVPPSEIPMECASIVSFWNSTAPEMWAALLGLHIDFHDVRFCPAKVAADFDKLSAKFKMSDVLG
jgi:hypothetical protein